MKQPLIAVIAAVGLAASPASVKRLDGSRITTAQIDAIVTRLMHATQVTGVGIAIFNDRRPVHVKTYGVRDSDKHWPLTTDSRFDIIAKADRDWQANPNGPPAPLVGLLVEYHQSIG